MSVRPQRKGSGIAQFALTDAAAGKALGTSDRTFRRWQKEPWFPTNAKSSKGWDIKKIAAARDAAGRKGSQVDEAREQRRQKRDDVDLAIKQQILAQETMKRQQLEGALFPRPAVELVHSTILTQISDFLDQQPHLIGAMAGSSERRAIELELKRLGDAFRDSLEKQLISALKEWDDLNK